LHKTAIALSVISIFILGCGGLTFLQPTPTHTSEPTGTNSPLPSPTEPFDHTQGKPITPQPTFPPTETFTPRPSETPPPTATQTDTPIPQWFLQGPGDLVVPILLYHHVGISPSNSPYYISPYDFEQQMYLLHKWGYQTISVGLLVRALREGAELPPKPIILTFDDGSATVFSNALPIMQKYNFVGTVYIVSNYIGIPNYMDGEQIRELHANGWEVGSHSLSHVDLTERADRQREEIIESRRRLEAILDLPILSFAYPFGAYNADSVQFARQAGYIAAVGLGESSLQGTKNLYYLYRWDITGLTDLQDFAASLPWQEDMSHLTVLTVIP
jgi:peptidoglycan/xylan/chitin deacetylase (PgdA/CDA1 family)